MLHALSTDCLNRLGEVARGDVELSSENSAYESLVDCIGALREALQQGSDNSTTQRSDLCNQLVALEFNMYIVAVIHRLLMLTNDGRLKDPQQCLLYELLLIARMLAVGTGDDTILGEQGMRDAFSILINSMLAPDVRQMAADIFFAMGKFPEAGVTSELATNLDYHLVNACSLNVQISMLHVLQNEPSFGATLKVLCCLRMC